MSWFWLMNIVFEQKGCTLTWGEKESNMAANDMLAFSQWMMLLNGISSYLWQKRRLKRKLWYVMIEISKVFVENNWNQIRVPFAHNPFSNVMLFFLHPRNIMLGIKMAYNLKIWFFKDLLVWAHLFPQSIMWFILLWNIDVVPLTALLQVVYLWELACR